jgi:hypothetical protein
MPATLENSSHNASSAVSNASNAKGTPQAATKLINLLVSDPIDLAGISNEIRRNPGLEPLVLRLGISLALSPDEPLNTVEEAVVVLGTSRLRVLIDLWSSTDSIPSDQREQASVPQNNSHRESASAATPEALYLTNFLRCLGCECSENALSGRRLEAWTSKVRHDQIVALTDLFMRDFFSLLPTIQPGFAQLAAPLAKHRPL